MMDLKKLICGIWLFQWILFSNAQEITKPLAGPGGLNGYSMNQADLFSTIKNRAALAQIKKKSIGLYGERRFLVEGLNNYLVEGAIATGSGCFGIELGYFGFSRFNQTRAGLAYALKLGSRMDAARKTVSVAVPAATGRRCCKARRILPIEIPPCDRGEQACMRHQ